MPPNFVLLDATLPDVARLVTAMVQARDAVESRSWSHPQEPTGEEWWADVLADPRTRKRERRTNLALRLRDRGPRRGVRHVKANGILNDQYHFGHGANAGNHGIPGYRDYSTLTRSERERFPHFGTFAHDR
jgi:hypothetical protein